MKPEDRQEYLEKYHKQKEEGVPFFPDILFKDALIALLVFLALIALAALLGAPLEARADPGDTSYTPRPEWYFLFLFQFLKYFPGKLEVIGAFIVPTLLILGLLALPFLDQSSRRHFAGRPLVMATTAIIGAGVVLLSVLALREAPPPTEVAKGDQTAALYTANCAACHGPSISVPVGTNLHAIIAQGKHEGMPSWASDLSTDQIDALAGFILSPGGSRLFTQFCAACHEAPELVAGDPLQLKSALEDGKQFELHKNAAIADWSSAMTPEERTTLLNFLIAPDGQRLFAINCSSCHGRSVAFSGTPEELREIIRKGGQHLEMPAWRGQLTPEQVETLARYVVEPAAVPEGAALFQQYCTVCHGERIPTATDVDQARVLISQGGAHVSMPVWGDILTSQQLDALVNYTLTAASGTPLEVGQALFEKNCSPCHGGFGEGGPNPTRQGDIIMPISSSEYLKTRDDFTLRSIISQGQPNFGMSPFSTANGGPLDDQEIDAIVAFMRAWEENPPVELPPQVVTVVATINGEQVYRDVCTQCHGTRGEGGLGPALRDPALQADRSDQQLYNAIFNGHPSTAMIAWGQILSAEQIHELVAYLRELGVAAVTPSPTSAIAPTPHPGASPTPAATPSFAADVLPVLQKNCAACHGSLGGWDSSSYNAVMTSGDHAPVVRPGDVKTSLLAQKLLGTQTVGGVMPMSGVLPLAEIQPILDWIAAGALNN
jgi:mono/diheme cytochrome c family protein